MAPGDLVDTSLVDLIFDPARGIMHTVEFASGSGTNFRESVLESRVPGSKLSIDLLLTDKKNKKGGDVPIGALKYATDFGVPARTINGFKYCGSWEEAKKTVEGIQAYERRVLAFNREMYKEVQKFEEENQMTFDFAVLAGYMRLFRGALQRRFNNRAVNVHPAALDVFNADGTRKYIGDKAVFEAISAGETRTRSSIILVEPETDGGAVLVSGQWVEYTGPKQVTQEDADVHQNLQKEKSDWPALRFALRAIANGEFGLHKRKFHPDGNPVVVYRGKEQPYQGVDLEKLTA